MDIEIIRPISIRRIRIRIITNQAEDRVMRLQFVFAIGMKVVNYL